VLTWNAHLAEGQLGALIDSLRAGQLTGGRPVNRFVLLLQELYRRGPDVPEFRGSARSAFAITARDPKALDARDYAQALGLSLVYVPSMRNGAELHEDRGNAIVSTEPLHDLFAHELPLERQRRVAIGASIDVRAGSGVKRLNVLSVHLEPLSSPSSLWVFRNPRRRQVASLLTLLRAPRFEPGTRSIGTVLGGDFNTIQGGVEEEAYTQARGWSQGMSAEDRRNTHHMGRIDYLFFRLAPGWTASTTRLEDKFGSDHYPVLGRFAPAR
jgi:endonuclease/exonuclease/phosphatase family metal-dependent hydrolase